MQIPFLHSSKTAIDTHEKPWGGVYARRMWRAMLGTTLVALLISLWITNKLYLHYIRPIVVSTSSLSSQIVELDASGLAKAVADIKDKEARFNQYLTQKIDILDPAQ